MGYIPLGGPYRKHPLRPRGQLVEAGGNKSGKKMKSRGFTSKKEKVFPPYL